MRSIRRKWEVCLQQVAESSSRFEYLSSSLPQATIDEWSADEILMQEFRAVDVSVMDSYDVQQDRGMSISSSSGKQHISQLPLAPSRSDIQLALVEREAACNVPPGSVAWVSSGLRLEEQQ